MKMLLLIAFILANNVVSAKARFEKVLPSIVSVLPIWENGVFNQQEPEGSGIVVGDGSKILTAAHVVKSAKAIRIRTIDGLILSAKILWTDRATDVALLEMSGKLMPLSLHSSGVIGDEVCTIGNSFGLGISVSCGVISAVERTDVGFNSLEDFVQTDAGMNPGKSGGALVNKDGQVIAMLSAIFTKKSDADIGINFAVSARLLKRLLQQRQWSVTWRKSPVELAPYPAGRKTGMSGARIVNIKPGSDALSFDFQNGDIIIRAGNRRIKKPKDFTTEFALFGQEIMPVTVMRNNVETQLNWRIAPSKGKQDEQ